MDALQAPRTVLRVTARLYQRISAQIILILAFLGILYFLTYFLLNSTFASRVFDQLVNSQFRGRMGWTRLQWGPLPWQLSVLEFVMADSQDRPVITAQRLRIEDLHLLDLLSLRIAASNILIEDPVIHLVARPHPESFNKLGEPTDMMNIEEMFLPPPGTVVLNEGAPPPPLVLDFEDARVVNAHFILDLPQIVVDVQGIDIDQARFAMAAQNSEGSMTIGATRLALRAGSVTLPRGELDRPVVDAPPADVMQFGFDEGVLRFFAWQRMRFTVASFTTAVRGDPVRVAGLEMGLDGPAPTLRASVGFDIAELQKHLEPLGIVGISGPMNITARGQGELASWQAQVEAQGSHLAAMGHELGAYLLRLTKAPDDQFRLTELTTTALGGEVQVNASFDLPRGEASAEVDFNHIDPGRLPELADQAQVRPLVQGHLDGRVRVRATDVLSADRHVSATVDLALQRTGRAIPGLARTVEVGLIAALDGGAVTLHRLQVDSGDDHVDVRGALDLATLEATATGRVAVASLAPLGIALGQPLAGALNASFEGRGTVADPQATVRLQGRGLRYADYPSGDVDGTFRYDNRTLRVGELTVRTDVGQVDVTGLVQLKKTPTFDLGVRVEGLDLASLPGGIDMAGRVRTPKPITLRGPLTQPRIAGRIEVDQPRYQRLQLDSVVVDGAWSGQTATVEELTVLAGGDARIDLKGTLDVRQLAYDAEVKINRIPLALADLFLEKPTGLKGLISLNFDGKGTPKAPHAEGHLIIQDFAVGADAFPDSTLDLTATGDEVTLKGRLVGAVDVDGRVPVSATEAGILTVSFTDLDPQKVLARLANPDWNAVATGQVVARFRPFVGALDSVEAELSTVKATWSMYDGQGQVVQTPGMTCPGCPTLEVTAARPIRVSFRHKVITVNDCTLSINRQHLGLSGTVGTDGSLDLALGGRADLALLRPFVQSTFTDFQGAAEVQLGVAGPASDPQARGWIRLARLDLVPRSAVVGGDIHLVEPVEVEIISPTGPRRMLPGADAPSKGVFSVILPANSRPTPERPSAPNRFLLRRDESTLAIRELGVEIENFGLERLFVSIDGNEVSLNVPQVVRGTFNFNDLTVELYQHRQRRRQSETRLRLGGDIDIQRLEYIADISPPGALNQEVADNITGRSRARQVSVFERVPLLKRLELDLHVHGDDEIYLRNNIAVLALDLELKLDLTARGFLVGTANDDTEDLLTLEGQIDILDDSQLVYQRRPFDVTQGIIRFGGTNFLEVDLTASHTFRLRTDQGGGGTFDLGSGGDVREEEVTLDLSVRMPTRDSEPRINPQLTSSSGASQIEVLTLLLTGQLPSDLTGADSAQPATEALLAPVLNLIEQPLEETLDLDLSLTAATTGTLFVDVDKFLSRRLRLYSRTPVGNDSATNPQTFGLEYRINNVATGELTTEQLGNNNATSGRLRLRLELD